MKRLVVGLLAHVDSGKTTLAEGLLYRAGVLRKLGRVDHRDAFLDTDSQERARGITIFAKQAVLTLPAADGADETELTLLDTPGHVDFFRRGRARLAGVGLRGAGRLRHRRRAGPHRDIVEAAGTFTAYLRLYLSTRWTCPARTRRAPAGAARAVRGRVRGFSAAPTRRRWLCAASR